MSLSFIARTRGQSVLDVLEVDRLLMAGRLSEGDDADHIAGFGVHHRNDHTIEEPKRHEALLAIFEAVVLIGIGWTIEDFRSVGEVQAVLSKVGLALGLVRCEPHRQLYQQTYIQGSNTLPGALRSERLNRSFPDN
jgi:hypothetical protein